MTIREKVLAAYAAYAKGDIEAALVSMSDDFCHTWPANKKNEKWTGRSNGKEAFMARLSGVVAEFDVKTMDVVDLLIDGNKACARIEQDLVVRATGELITNHAVHIWEFDGDQCSNIYEYYDTALVNEHSAA